MIKLKDILLGVLLENAKTQAEYYRRQNIEPEVIKYYIERFEYIKKQGFKEIFNPDLPVSVPVNRRTDIDAYKEFSDLEQVVDYVMGQRSGVSTLGKMEDIEVDGKPVFENDRFEVYYADSPRACIKYKGNVPYSWCVARADSSNMFFNYRFKPYEPAFYFVKDKEMSKKQFEGGGSKVAGGAAKFEYPYHFFVVQVTKDANKGDDNSNQYIVTSANNDGDKTMSWNKIKELIPGIDEIKGVLQPKPFTPGEREEYERFKRGLTDEEFAKMKNYESWSRYLDIYPAIGRGITDYQFSALPFDLKNKYISFGIGMTDAQLEIVRGDSKLLKRYKQITERKLEEYLKNINSYDRNSYKLSYNELIVLPDESVSEYLDSLNLAELDGLIKSTRKENYSFFVRFGKGIYGSEDMVGYLNNKDEAALNKLLPEGVELYFSGRDIVFVYDEYVYLEIEEELATIGEVKDILDNNRYNYDIDVDEGYIYDIYNNSIENFINNYQSEFLDDFIKYKFEYGFDADEIRNLLQYEQCEDNIESDIRVKQINGMASGISTELYKIEKRMDNKFNFGDNELRFELEGFINTIGYALIFDSVEADVVFKVVESYFKANKLPLDYSELQIMVEENSGDEADYSGVVYDIYDCVNDAFESHKDYKKEMVDMIDNGRYRVERNLEGLGLKLVGNTAENDYGSLDFDFDSIDDNGLIYTRYEDKVKGSGAYLWLDVDDDWSEFFEGEELEEQLRRIKSLIR